MFQPFLYKKRCFLVVESVQKMGRIFFTHRFFIQAFFDLLK